MDSTKSRLKSSVLYFFVLLITILLAFYIVAAHAAAPAPPPGPICKDILKYPLPLPSTLSQQAFINFDQT